MKKFLLVGLALVLSAGGKLATANANDPILVSCYPVAHADGPRVVVKQGRGPTSFGLNLWEKGKDAVEAMASGKDYGEGRLKADAKDVNLNVGNQFVADSTLGNYSYLVGVIQYRGKTHPLRCYHERVHLWTDFASFYRRVVAEDILGVLQIAEGRLESQGYSKVVRVTKTERTIPGKPAVTLYAVNAVYEKPAKSGSEAKTRTLQVTGSLRPLFNVTVDSAEIREGAQGAATPVSR